MTSKPVGSGITSPERGLIVIDPVQVELDIIERPQNQDNNNPNLTIMEEEPHKLLWNLK